MKAVVMAGGEGTRLRPLTSNQPKPMVPIVGKPCMEHIIDLLRRHDMTEVVVTVAFMPQAIRSYFGDGESLGIDIDYSVEEQPLGTAGSVRLARERLDETFIVISGDALCDVDLTELVEAHKAKGAAVTIGLKSVDNPLEFGIVVTDEDGRVERFLEKPSWGQVFSDTINTGIYVLEPEVLRHIPADGPYDFSKELFPLLLEMGRPIYGHVLGGYWQDIGNLDQFRQANFDALDGRVQLEVPGLRLRGNVWVSEEVDIGEVEGVEGPAFIGVNCRIADGASIGPYSVLSRGVIVREGARVERSVIDAGTYLGRSAVVEGAILGRGCDLRDHVRVHEGVAIGDQVTIGPEASLFPGVRVYPFKEIETGAQIHESVVWETRATTTPFGRDGATGLVNVDLTPETAVRLAAALGTALRRGDRVVASRASADACRMIQRALIAGLTSTGVHVADLRISPAAVTRHVLKTQALQAGIHVGRSSIDPEVIHVRVFEWPGNQMTSELQKEVEKHFSRQELRRATFAEVGETTYPARVRESYAQDILDALDVESIRRRRFRVAVDYGYSPAAFTLPLVLGPLGVEAIGARGFYVEEVGEELEPIDARKIVTGVRAHLGVVLDRAAERLLLDRRARRHRAGRPRPPTRRTATRAGRPLRPDRGARHCERPRRRAGAGLRPDGGADAAFGERADPRRDRGGRRAGGGADRWLRVPRRGARLRRRHRRLQAARAAGDPGAPDLGARRRASPADAGAPRASVPLGPQGPRDAASERATRLAPGRPPGRGQGIRRARLGAGSARSGRAARPPLRRGRDRGAHDRAGRRGRLADRGRSCRETPPSSEPWSKPQVEVDPSAVRLLESMVPDERCSRSPWMRFPTSPA